MTQPWNMAKVRSRQLPRKYKPVGPVGAKLDVASYNGRPSNRYTFARGEVSACVECGYHVCSCEPCTGFPQCKSCYPRPCRAKPGGMYELSCGCVCMTAPQFRERWPDAEIRSDSRWFHDGVGPRWSVMRVYHQFAGIRRYCAECQP